MPNPESLGKSYHKLSWQKRKLLTQPHLPQGAPTSPALANLCLWKLDKRLNGLAKKMDIRYSRYADDLAFSGGRHLYKNNLYMRKLIEHIVTEEGFSIHHAKTFTASQSQRQTLTGIVVNRHPNISRREYDEIKAILYNCKTFGVEKQNRAQHPNFKDYLHGKISYIASINSSKGERLLKQFYQIDWVGE